MDPDEEMEEYCHGDRLPHWADGDRCMNYGDPGAPAERPRPPDGEGPAAPAGGAGDGFDGWDDYNFPRENGDAGAEAAPRPPASEAPGGTPPPPPSRGGGGEHPPSSTEATPANSRDTQSATFRRAAGAGEAGRSLGLGFLAGTPPGDVPSEMRGGGAGASRGTNGGGAEVKTGEAVSPDEATAPKAPAGTVADPSSSSSSPSKLQASADKGEITADRLNGSEGGRRRGARASRPTRTSSFDYTPHVRKYSRRKGTAGSEDGKGAAADAVPSSAEGKAALATAGKGDGDAIATKKRKRGPGRPRKDGKEKRGRGRPRKDAAAKYPLGKVPERREPPPKTPAELYGRIQKSRDRLFFVAYRQDDDDDDKQRSPSGGGGSGRRPSSAGGRRRTEQRKHWYLVRVDVGTAERQLDMRPEESGEYYVEFYAKASYDCGVLLVGRPLEAGVSSSHEMRVRPDTRSRYWLDFREFHYEGDDMIVGRSHEINPNAPKAIARRLLDLARRTHDDDGKDGDGDKTNGDGDRKGGDETAANGNDEKDDGETASDGNDEKDGGEEASDGNDKTENGNAKDDDDDDDDDDSVGSDSSESRRIMLEYNAPDLGKYTPWADIVNLVDPGVRLVGPFDFEDVPDPPPAALDEETLRGHDGRTRALYEANRAGLCVRDRVPQERWGELMLALSERDDGIEPPTVLRPGDSEDGPACTVTLNYGRGRKPSPPKEAGGRPPSVGGKRPRSTDPAPGPAAGRRGRPPRRLSFGATPSRPALELGRDDPRAVPREDVLAAVRRAMDGSRSDRSGKREYFVGDEVRDAISEALGAMLSDRRTAAKTAGGGSGERRPASSDGAAGAGRRRRDAAAIVVDAICDGCAGGPAGAVDDLPVAFSYHVDERDVLGASKEDARIATLDHEVKERKRRRLARKEEAEQKRRPQQPAGNDGGDDADDGDSRSVSTAASSFRPDDSARSASGGGRRRCWPRDITARAGGERDPDLPDGWTRRHRKRRNDERADGQWFSPVLGLRFSSRAQARRFVARLEQCGGDEEAAIADFGG